jgi:hypothetical protein
MVQGPAEEPTSNRTDSIFTETRRGGKSLARTSLRFGTGELPTIPGCGPARTPIS